MNGSRAFFAWALASSLERNAAARRHRDNHAHEWMPELLPLTAADCASSTSETTSEKPKKTQFQLPGPRWSNRAYPRKDAVLNPRPQGEGFGTDKWSERSVFVCLRTMKSYEIRASNSTAPLVTAGTSWWPGLLLLLVVAWLGRKFWLMGKSSAS